MSSTVMAIAALAAFASVAAAQGLTVPVRDSESPSALVVEDMQLYRASHALVIGIDAYTAGWPRLSNAVKDAREVAEELKRHGFSVTLKTDLEADEFKRTLEDFFVVRGEDPDARLFLWYAGHGHTEDGEGFLVPADAPRADTGSRFRLKALALRRFGEYVRLARSKHVFAVFDACFSGTIFSAQRSLPPRAITRATQLPVRQFLSSGDADQPVFDNGTFRELFIRALRGEEGADANGDGYVTASEVGLFLTDRVTNLTRTRQTPRYGKLLDKDYDRGEYVFQALPLAPTPARAAPPLAAAPAPGTPTRSPDALTVELAFWDSIKSSTNPADYRAYLESYPNGRFASLARARAGAAAAPAPAPTPAAASPAPQVALAPAPPPRAEPPTRAAPPAQAARTPSPPQQQAVVTPPQPPRAAEPLDPNAPVRFTPPAPGTRLHLSSGDVYQVLAADRWTVSLRDATGASTDFIACCAFTNRRHHTETTQTGCSPPAPSCDYPSPVGGRDAGGSLPRIWPLKEGNETQWSHEGSSPYDSWRFAAKVVRRETVSVPAGQFETLVIEVSERGQSRNIFQGRETFWFAPKLGFPVKYEARNMTWNAKMASWELTRIEP